MENSTLRTVQELSLGPHQEHDVLVLLEGEWTEDTVVSQHPDFAELNIEVVGGIADEGDHMSDMQKA